MCDDINFDLESRDFRALSDAEWADLKQRVERRARADRGEAIRSAVAALWALPDRLAETAGPWIAHFAVRTRLAARHAWRAYRVARRRRLAVRQLNALDDRSLKDIGLRRGGIHAAVYRHDPAGIR
jgi:uncharacterized protein YjiS (DUF1127 family)